MPGFVTHALFPLLPLLAFTRYPRRLVLALAPVAFLPDLDYVVGVHRATLHNLFLVAGVFAAAFAARGRLQPAWRDGLEVAGIYLGVHLLMDVFAGGVVPLWPASNTTWLVDFSIDVGTRTNTPYVAFDWGTSEGPPTVSRVYAFLTYTEAAMLATVVAFGVALAAARVPRRPGNPGEP